jgi:hypothetical protein
MPRKIRFIYANKRKTDEIDAENLARLDPRLLYPLKHRSGGSQAHQLRIGALRRRPESVGGFDP